MKFLKKHWLETILVLPLALVLFSNVYSFMTLGIYPLLFPSVFYIGFGASFEELSNGYAFSQDIFAPYIPVPVQEFLQQTFHCTASCYPPDTHVGVSPTMYTVIFGGGLCIDIILSCFLAWLVLQFCYFFAGLVLAWFRGVNGRRKKGA